MVYYFCVAFFVNNLLLKNRFCTLYLSDIRSKFLFVAMIAIAD